MSKSVQLMNTPSTQDFIPILPRRLESTFLSIADLSRHYSLSELLPYNPLLKLSERLIAGLKEYDFLLTVAENAMEWLGKGHISCFDPLVGENACQIRALKNCLIFSKYPINSDELLKKIRLSRKNTEELLTNISMFVENKFSLDQLLKIENIDVKLTYSEIYLIKSYLLTIVKTVKPPKEDMPFVKNEYTDTKKLKSIKPIGTMFAESLIKKLRESLSAFSVSFVQELSSRLAPEPINDILSDKFYIRHNRLHCLPCYWATRVLMTQSLKSRIPLVIIARQLAKDQNCNILREIVLFFKPTLFGYKPTTANSFNSDNPALTLLVNSCREAHEFPDLTAWQAELLEYNPIDLVLAYAASHRQYPDIMKNDLIDQIQDQEYEFYKKKALEWGCSIENPSRFFLSHAFCEKVGNISNHIFLADTKHSLPTTTQDTAAQFIDAKMLTLSMRKKEQKKYHPHRESSKAVLIQSISQ